MDRRYSANRFYNGTPASDGQSQRREAILAGYLGEIKRVNRQVRSQSEGDDGGSRSAGGVDPSAQRAAAEQVAQRSFSDPSGPSLRTSGSFLGRGYGSAPGGFSFPGE